MIRASCASRVSASAATRNVRRCRGMARQTPVSPRGEPWLPLNADWRERNVEAFERDACSMLNLYRRLLALRRTHPALSVGDISLLEDAGRYSRL